MTEAVAEIARNQARDRIHLATLPANGWQSLGIWRCGLKQRDVRARPTGTITERKQ